MRLPVHYTYCDITLKINDILASNDLKHSPFSYYHEQSPLEIQSYIGIPLWVNDSLYGTIAFTSREARQELFTEREKTFMKRIARSAEYFLR